MSPARESRPKRDEAHPSDLVRSSGKRVWSLGGEASFTLVAEEREAALGGRGSGLLPGAGSLLVVTSRVLRGSLISFACRPPIRTGGPSWVIHKGGKREGSGTTVSLTTSLPPTLL